MTLARDYDALRANLEWTDNRSIHATIQYSPATAYAESWARFKRTEKGREWEDGSPTLDYADIEAYAPFADIDLDTDELKEARLTGELDTAPVEAALTEYIEAFAELAGGREHVYALDSVGGAYVMVAPTCTRPIAELFADDRDARERVFSELRARIDEWLGDVREDVNEAVPAAEGVFEPDLLNQKNRNYKAPLTVHKDLDGVVTPMDTDAPVYEFTHLSEADDALIEETTEWAAGFTADHESAVGSVVATLWPDEHADGDADGWEDALESWLDEERTAEQERENRQRKLEPTRKARLEDIGLSLAGQAVTPYMEDVFDAINEVDIEHLVRKYCSEWEPKPAQRDNHFNPGKSLWKESDSGTSCYVDQSDNAFVDVGDNGGKGGPAKFMALKEDAISKPNQRAKGEAFRVGVEALRKEGYDIPVRVPEAGSEKSGGGTYEKTPYWALKKAAVATRVLPPGAFIDRDRDDGGSYEGFPGKETFNRTLAELEDRGIDHGWEYLGTAEDRERARKRLTNAEVDRRIEEQHGDDEQAAGIARVLADARTKADNE